MPKPQPDNGSARRPTIMELLRWARELERGRLEVFASLPPEEILPGPGAAARRFSPDDAREFAKAFRDYEEQYQQQVRDFLPPFAVSGGGAKAANDNGVASAAGRSLEAGGQAAETVGKGMQVAAKGGELASEAAGMAGKGVEMAGQGVKTASQAAGQALQTGGQAATKAGTSMTEAGAGLSSTGLGAIVGVPLMAAGGLTTLGGGAATAAGAGTKTVGGAVGSGMQAGGKAIQSGAEAGKQASRAVGQTGKQASSIGQTMKDAAGLSNRPFNPLARLPVMGGAPGVASEEDRAAAAGGREPGGKGYLKEKARDVKDLASTFIGVGGGADGGVNPLMMARMIKKYASLPPRVLVSATVLEIKKIIAVDIWDWYGIIYIPVYAWINFEYNDYIRSTATLAKSFLREAPPSFKKMVPPQVMAYIQLNLMTVEEQHMFHWLDWFAATLVWGIIVMIIVVIIGVVVKIIDNPLAALGAASGAIVGFTAP